MNRDGHKDVVYFVGPEVEHTPAFSKKTLFVVGYREAEEVEKIAREHKTPHIYLGADHSFDASHNTEYFTKTWDSLITKLLDKGFWVTLDYPAHQHETVLKMLNAGIWQCRLFVPMLSVRIPKVQTSSVNLTIKIDDIDFKATNPGVWCLNHHEITDSNRFTDWNEYGDDVVVELQNEVVEDRQVHYIDVGAAGPAEAAAIVEAIVAQNEQSTGLDPDRPSQLKPATDEEENTTVNVIVDTASAAEAYADGTTEDPLGKNATAKKQKVKKTEA